jgi:predicted nuclease of predicted toxin-antitoxin system
VVTFLIDENLSPALTSTANALGFAAFHVAHRGWASASDDQVLRRMLDESLTLVTNNWLDFKPMLAREGLHPGVVVILPNVRRQRQAELFALALLLIRDSDPPLDMINTVLEVTAEGVVTRYALSND